MRRPVPARASARLLFSATLVLGLAASGCQKKSASQDTPGGAPPLTLEALKNGAYLSEFAGPERARLVNGLYENGPEQVAIQLLSDKIARGDLNGDGAEDAACLLTTNSGGSGSFVDLAAVLNRKGAPENVARLQLGDRVVVNSVRIEGRTIIVDMVTHGPGDALCCPTLAVVQNYRLDGTSLRSVDR